MAELKIEMLGSPVLRERAIEVETTDDDLRRLVDDMFATMYAAEGIGLAAPQVGVGQRVLVVDLNDEESGRYALVNPRIVEKGREMDRVEEGCLSIPGVSEYVERPVSITVEALDPAGAPVRIEASGMLARCLQHEIDHLDGILFIDHLSPLKRSMLLKRYRAQRSEDEPETSGRGTGRQRR